MEIPQSRFPTSLSLFDFFRARAHSKNMKAALFAAFLLLPVMLQAGVVKIISPDSAQTYSYSRAVNRWLYWDAEHHRLFARITFSTVDYVTKYEPLQEETYKFTFPGVKFDRSTNTFYAKTSGGKRVPVAVLSKDLIGQSIKPLPGTVIYIFKRSGHVVVALTGSTIPPGNSDRLHWVEDNSGFFLDNAAKAGIAALGN